MSKPVITDKDVLDLVRKEFERKIADYMKQHNLEPEEKEADEDAEEEMGNNDDDLEDNPMGKRNPPKPAKTDELDIESLRKSIGLRVSHRDSGLEYYLRGINPGSQIIDMETPEGHLFQVDFHEFEDEYKLG